MKAENTNIGATCALNKITPFTSELAPTKDFSSLIHGNRHIQVSKYTFLNIPTLYGINR